MNCHSGLSNALRLQAPWVPTEFSAIFFLWALRKAYIDVLGTFTNIQNLFLVIRLQKEHCMTYKQTTHTQTQKWMYPNNKEFSTTLKGIISYMMMISLSAINISWLPEYTHPLSALCVFGWQGCHQDLAFWVLTRNDFGSALNLLRCCGKKCSQLNFAA